MFRIKKTRKPPRPPETFAYGRVSTKDQNADRQLVAFEPFEIAKRNIYIDKKSGKDFDRPRYKALVRKLRAGDLLILKSIDRLGRDYVEIIEQWRYLTKDKGVDIKVIDFPLLDTTYCKGLLGTFISDLVLQVLSFAAQLERENILQRQAEGIAVAKANGVVFGRSPVEIPSNFDEICREWRNGGLTAKQAAKLCGFSRKTLYNLTVEMRAAEG